MMAKMNEKEISKNIPATYTHTHIPAVLYNRMSVSRARRHTHTHTHKQANTLTLAKRVRKKETLEWALRKHTFAHRAIRAQWMSYSHRCFSYFYLMLLLSLLMLSLHFRPSIRFNAQARSSGVLSTLLHIPQHMRVI